MRLIENPGKITGGKVFLNGRDLLQLPESQMEEVRGGEMAMIFQEPMTALNPVLTIGQQIDEQILRHKKVSPSEARERSIEMLNLVGIPSSRTLQKLSSPIIRWNAPTSNDRNVPILRSSFFDCR